MSKYEEVCNAFAESFKRQNESINDCCQFGTFIFDEMGRYFEWPRNLISFSRDQILIDEKSSCRDVAILGNDGYTNFIVIFKVQRPDNPNHYCQILISTKIKRFEENFSVKIGYIEKTFFFSEDDSEAREDLYEYILKRLKRHFATPFLNWDVPRLLDEMVNEDELEE
jgi:hypothetical protein